MQYFLGFVYFLIMAAVIIGAYFVVSAARTLGLAPGKYISLVDRLMLGRDKGILIIRVGGKIRLISEGAQGFNILCELEESDMVRLPEQDTGFKNILNNYIKKKQPRDTDDSGNRISEIRNRMTDLMKNLRGRE
jgi:flagellar protein FliO/FliZ